MEILGLHQTDERICGRAVRNEDHHELDQELLRLCVVKPSTLPKPCTLNIYFNLSACIYNLAAVLFRSGPTFLLRALTLTLTLTLDLKP